MGKVKPIGYICFDKENMSEEDRELAELFWLSDEEDPKKFVYRINDLSDKFGFLGVYKTSQIIKRHYGFSFNSSQYCCDLCRSKKLVFTRGTYKSSLSAKNFRCSKCIEKVAAEKELFRCEQLQIFNDECLLSNYHINDFSFIEKIFVLTFLSNNYHLSFGDIFFLPEKISVTGNQELDLEIISALVNKNIIFDSTAYFGDLDIPSILDLNSFQDAFFLFKKSTKYMERNVFMTKLYENIINPKIDNNDLGEIKTIIESMRLNNIYDLSHYWAEKRRIEIKSTTKIDSTFKYMARKFTLMQCACLIFNKAKDVAAYLHTEDISHYAQPHLFACFLERYLGNIEVKAFTIYPSTYLPNSINSSLFESMVCSLFMPKLNWHEMTTQEIMDEWISALDIVTD